MTVPRIGRAQGGTLRMQKRVRKHGCFTKSRGNLDREGFVMTLSVTATALFVSLIAANATMPAARPPLVLAQIVLAQAMVPPTGMDGANKPMPMVERMNRRFPQPGRVGDLIGLPVL